MWIGACGFILVKIELQFPSGNVYKLSCLNGARLLLSGLPVNFPQSEATVPDRMYLQVLATHHPMPSSQSPSCLHVENGNLRQVITVLCLAVLARLEYQDARNHQKSDKTLSNKTPCET